MLLTRAQKEEKVARISQNLDKSKSVILVNYQGMTVPEINKLKANLREQGISFEIIKNTLFKIAVRKAGIKIDETLLDQPVAIVWGSDDEVTPAKLTVAFTKEAEKFEVIGGIVNGEFSDKNMIIQLSTLPGRDELYAKLVGSLNAPMFRLVNSLQGNLRGLVSILDQYKQQKI